MYEITPAGLDESGRGQARVRADGQPQESRPRAYQDCSAFPRRTTPHLVLTASFGPRQSVDGVVRPRNARLSGPIPRGPVVRKNDARPSRRLVNEAIFVMQPAENRANGFALLEDETACPVLTLARQRPSSKAALRVQSRAEAESWEGVDRALSIGSEWFDWKSRGRAACPLRDLPRTRRFGKWLA
jgi:hypothetical protein